MSDESDKDVKYEMAKSLYQRNPAARRPGTGPNKFEPAPGHPTADTNTFTTHMPRTGLQLFAIDQGSQRAKAGRGRGRGRGCAGRGRGCAWRGRGCHWPIHPYNFSQAEPGQAPPIPWSVRSCFKALRAGPDCSKGV